MPRTVKYNGVTQQFPDDATDDEIRAALEAADKPAGKTVAGFGSNILTSGVKFLKDMVRGADYLGGKGVEAVLDPVGTVNNIAQFHPLDALSAMKEHFKKRYPSVQGALETTYEDPIGVLSDISTVAGGVGAAGKLGALGKVPMAGKVGRVATAVSNATNPLNVGRIPMAMTPKKSTTAMAERLQESALKIPPSINRGDRMAMIRASLSPENRIVAGESGLNKTRAIIDDINDKVDTAVTDAAQAGKTADPEVVAGYTKRSKGQFSEQVNSEADLAAIEGSKQEFLRKHSAEAPFTEVQPATEFEGYIPTGTGTTRIPQAIPLDVAQAEKRGTYRKLRDSSYGEMSTATKEAQKDLARGLKDQVYDQLPDEIKALGPKEKILIDLESVLERFANREGNKQFIPLPTAASHGITMGLITKFIDGSPALKSQIAIAMANRGGPAGMIRRTGNKIKALGPPAAAFGASQNRQ